jgi:hypothetical protein
MASFRSEAEAFSGIVWQGRRSCQACQRPETPGFSPGSGSFPWYQVINQLIEIGHKVQISKKAEQIYVISEPDIG